MEVKLAWACLISTVGDRILGIKDLTFLNRFQEEEEVIKTDSFQQNQDDPTFLYLPHTI
jgi:hypothetical protein